MTSSVRSAGEAVWLIRLVFGMLAFFSLPGKALCSRSLLVTVNVCTAVLVAFSQSGTCSSILPSLIQNSWEWNINGRKSHKINQAEGKRMCHLCLKRSFPWEWRQEHVCPHSLFFLQPNSNFHISAFFIYVCLLSAFSVLRFVIKICQGLLFGEALCLIQLRLCKYAGFIWRQQSAAASVCKTSVPALFFFSFARDYPSLPFFASLSQSLSSFTGAL